MINDKFQSLSEKIKKWLSSTDAFFTLGEIIEKFGIEYEKEAIIPELVFRLCIKELDPLDFIYELSQKMGINFEQAKTISEEIEEKILRPIKSELRNDAGVDIKMIYFGKPGTRAIKEQPEPAAPIIGKSFRDFIPRKPGSRNSAASLSAHSAMQNGPAEFTLPGKPGEAPTPATPTAEPTIDLQTFEIKNKENLVRSDLTNEPTEPFILHQEDQLSGPSKSSIKPELNIKVQDYYQTTQPEQKKTPISVEIETPQQDPNLVRSDLTNIKTTARVVHYSNLRTPVNNLGLAKKPLSADENTVDLRKFSK